MGWVETELRASNFLQHRFGCYDPTTKKSKRRYIRVKDLPVIEQMLREEKPDWEILAFLERHRSLSSLEQLADWLVSRKDIDALLTLLLNRTNMACICRNCQLKSNED